MLFKASLICFQIHFKQATLLNAVRSHLGSLNRQIQYSSPMTRVLLVGRRPNRSRKCCGSGDFYYYFIELTQQQLAVQISYFRLKPRFRYATYTSSQFRCTCRI